MVSISRTPSAPLAPFVHTLWYVDEPVPAGVERRVPTGTMQLVVNLAADELRWFEGSDRQRVRSVAGAGLCGALSRPIGIYTADRQASVGVSFRPGGAVPFFHPPVDALAEPVISLDAIWGTDGADLRERLLAAARPAEVLRILEEVLLSRIVRPDMPAETRPRELAGIRAAVSALDQGFRVGDVVDRSGWSASAFTRRFRAAVGLNPKPFARVRRVQRVLASVTCTGAAIRTGDVDWSAIAVEHGYFDQAHLINEFRALTGATPSSYLRAAPPARNHVPVRG